MKIKRPIGYVLLEEFGARQTIVRHIVLSQKEWKRIYRLFSQHWVMNLIASASIEISSGNDDVVGILEKICKVLNYQYINIYVRF